MKKIIYPLFFVLAACQNEAIDTSAPVQEEQLPTKGKQSLAQYAERMMRAKLGIQANEQLDYKIYKAQLDADGIEDAIITLNRKDFAMKEAMASPNPAKRAELGFMGNYN